MNQADLITLLTQQLPLTEEQAAKALDITFSAIIDSLAQGQNISFADFGRFQYNDRPAMVLKSPQTGEDVSVGPRRMAIFRAAPYFKKRLQQSLQEPQDESPEIIDMEE